MYRKDSQRLFVVHISLQFYSNLDDESTFAHLKLENKRNGLSLCLCVEVLNRPPDLRVPNKSEKVQ